MKKSVISALILASCSQFIGAVDIVVMPQGGSGGQDEVPSLGYNLATQEFTIDFGEVDEISSGRVVIHDDSDGYQVKNFLVTPACHEFTFTCPLQGTLYVTITTPHGDTYAGTTEN